MNPRRSVPALLAGLVLSLVTPAAAQNGTAGWYAGAGIGRLDIDFEPYYTYYAGGTPDQFHNEANGLEIEFRIGRQYRLSDRWSLSLEGNGALNRVRWSLSIPEEPAELEYSLPYRFAFAAVPALHLGRVSVGAAVGSGLGRVHQMKTSPSSSAYDYDTLRPAFSVGGDVGIRVSPGLEIYARMSRLRHLESEFDTFAPGNVRVEHVTDSPWATGVTVGIIRRF
jgi:hypothetical protein